MPNWAQTPTIRPATGFPKPITQNLTEQALRARGVAEPDIAAAIGNPERMKQLVYQTFGAGSAKAPAAPDDLWSGGPPTEPHPNGVRDVPGLPVDKDNTRRTFPTPPTLSATPPKATPDKYQQAAIEELAGLKQAGGPPNEYERRLLNGFFFGADKALMAGAFAPIEAYRHGINPQEDYRYARALWEGYKYAKAREDLLDEESRKNTGNLGSGLEALGGAARQGDLEKKLLAKLFP